MPPKKKLEFDPAPNAPFAAEPGQVLEYST